MALTQDMRGVLADRVQRAVAGRGIARQVIDDAVARVADALDRQSAPPEPETSTEHIVAVFSAPSTPDLGSRVRSALHAASVAPLALGSATAGRHTVVTARLAARDRVAVERAAAGLDMPVAFVSDSSPRSLSP